ncbi:hypothetical protein Tco_0380122, partial [Tanacetum coccineum]
MMGVRQFKKLMMMKISLKRLHQNFWQKYQEMMLISEEEDLTLQVPKKPTPLYHCK